jgi:flavin reductase (DIM6/NTAB) family NADH-FMN oxidoreductase RutF
VSSQHVLVDPAILYFGTPVALIGTRSSGGAANLMPMSSVFWLGHTAVLGLGSRSRTAINLQETRECVINLPESSQVDAVDRLALTTGRDPVPPRKASVGYEYVADKFAHAGLTSCAASTVRAPRVEECPVNLEGKVVDVHALEKDDPAESGSTQIFEVKITAVHVHEAIRMAGTAHRVDPEKWNPLLMSFQRFFGRGEEVLPSRLASIDEEWYR